MSNKKNLSVTDIASTISGLNQRVSQLENLLQNSFVWQQRLAAEMQMSLVRSIPHSRLHFETALAEHCNLNCRGCDHFSPLAKPELANFEKLSSDFRRLSDLFGRRICKVGLLGGEPLLNPDVTEYLKMSREIFPNSTIHIITNGTLLLKMPDEFWTTCRDKFIVIFVTKYPISFNYKEAEERAKYYQVDFRYFNAGEQVKKLFQMKLDVDGTQDDRKSFLSCYRGGGCIYLQNGRLYTCTVAPTARHFDKHFGTHIFDEESNSISIYEANSAEEILEFLAKPIPFCSHCKVAETIYGIDWRMSRKDMSEWT